MAAQIWGPNCCSGFSYDPHAWHIPRRVRYHSMVGLLQPGFPERALGRSRSNDRHDNRSIAPRPCFNWDGDAGNDWLGLEVRKGQGYARFLGTREVVGRIEVVDDQNKFRIISSREGIVKDNNFKQLADKKQGYFYQIFKKLEKYVVKGLDWDKLSKKNSGTQEGSETEKMKAFLKNFEKKVKSRSWKFSAHDEKYYETQKKKDVRSIAIIYSIINVKPENIIELYINSELIIALAEVEKENIKKIFKDFEKYDSNILDKGTIKSLNKIKNLLKKAMEESKTQEERADKLERTTLFLRSISSQDLENVVNLHHHIGISSNIIYRHLYNLKKRIDKGETIDYDSLDKFIKKISYENNKILTITKFATKANFNLEGVDIKENLTSYIKDYLLNVCGSDDIFEAYDHSKLNISCKVNPETLVFKTWFKPIEISMIFDNLISNSVKARAKNIKVSLERLNKDELLVKYLDDGTKKILDEDLPKIFDYGFTTTSGSGLGMYHVKTIIGHLGGKISVKNRDPVGTEFTIKFRRDL